MRHALLALALAGCASDFHVVLRPTTPSVQSSQQPIAIASKRVTVFSTGAGAVATAAAEQALLEAGWKPVVPVQKWVCEELDGDEVEDEGYRFIVRAVREGLDSGHPIDGCASGPHIYPYWMEVDAALSDGNGQVIWTGHVRVRSTDLLRGEYHIWAYSFDEQTCDHMSPLHPVWNVAAVRDAACLGGTMCDDKPAHPAPLLKLAVEKLVGELGHAVRTVEPAPDANAQAARRGSRAHRS
jgi:hypothetical protein